eukprot:TRINITY_DN17814_c0_g1_i1.p1 TRINITY_DN17814_c0_g1~~TRINITY_DN17814_c0_g1_i1.p1  ORF type:complete len:764 (+),score=145.83 TRINITY_DN17814_c0_g1_i1:45-2336(+)
MQQNHATDGPEQNCEPKEQYAQCDNAEAESKAKQNRQFSNMLHALSDYHHLEVARLQEQVAELRTRLRESGSVADARSGSTEYEADGLNCTADGFAGYPPSMEAQGRGDETLLCIEPVTTDLPGEKRIFGFSHEDADLRVASERLVDNASELPGAEGTSSQALRPSPGSRCMTFDLKPTWKIATECTEVEDFAGPGLDANGGFAFQRPQSSRRPVKTVSEFRQFRESVSDTVRAAAMLPRVPFPTSLTVSPNCSWRLAWDVVGLVLISYDVITIPLLQAFEPSKTLFVAFMDWVTLLFWTGDLLQSFFIGFYDKGTLIMNHRRIVKHYLVTWFFMDMIVVGPEWMMLIIVGSAEGGGGGNLVSDLAKIMRTARAVRVLRLLRLLKLQRIINLLYDTIESEYMFICFNLVKLLISVLVLNHVIACLWFLTGRTGKKVGVENWVEYFNVIEENNLGYQYTTSLHWSLTQFTPASMDISARNVVERVFSIVVLFFAMVAFSSIVGSITSSMTSLANMAGDEMKQFWLLRRYLRQREVPRDLSRRIVKFLEHQMSTQNKLVQANSVKILGGISEQLHSELLHTMNAPHLLGHPFFAYLNLEMKVVVQRLSRLALKLCQVAEGDVVFAAGDDARKFYFIKSGLFEYASIDRALLAPPPQTKEWVGEAVLWVTWRHLGAFRARIPSELLVVEPDQFTDVMMMHPRPWSFAKRYAAFFVEFLNSIEMSAMTDILRHESFYDHAVAESDHDERMSCCPVVWDSADSLVTGT